MPVLNPVEKRLKKAAQAWENLLAQDEVRLGRLLGTVDDRQLFETFLMLEAEPEGQLPDLFLRFDAPFTRPDLYVLSLIEKIEAATRGDETITPYQAPQPTAGMNPADAWIRVVEDFVAKQGSAFEAIGFYLEPSAIGPAHDWMRFLFAIAKHARHPEKARHLVWDSLEAPLLAPLCDADKVRIATERVDLDMYGALNEIAAQGDDGSDGAVFRRHFTALSTSAGKGDMTAAESHGKKALNLAQTQGWNTLQVAVYVALAAGRLGAKDFKQAYASYDKGREAAEAATAQGDASGPKLELQAWAGKASTLIAMGDFDRACLDYESMAQKAESQGDDRMALEGWRMAAYCREARHDWDGSFERNAKAVKAAERMKPEEREASTLPYVGQAFTRITQKTHKEQARPIREYFDKLMPGWEDKIQRRADNA